jgi:hypothetical protein
VGHALADAREKRRREEGAERKRREREGREKKRRERRTGEKFLNLTIYEE